MTNKLSIFQEENWILRVSFDFAEYYSFDLFEKIEITSDIHFYYFLGYGKCQFNLEYQGDYIVQVKNNLTDVVIRPETISIWGECHLKVPGGNVIIINRYRLPNRH